MLVARVLVVCMGNICRSPTAEGVMRGLVEEAGLSEQIVLDSAGTGGWHVGAPPDRASVTAAAGRGIQTTARAREVRAADFDESNCSSRSTAQRARPAPPRRTRAAAKVRLLRGFIRPTMATSTCRPNSASTTAPVTCSTSSMPPVAGCSTSCAPVSGAA